ARARGRCAVRPWARALACGTCGGALAVTDATRVVRCPWCARKKLVLLPGAAKRLVVRAAVSARAAHTAALQALADPRLTPGLAATVRVSNPRLYYVQFWE